MSTLQHEVLQLAQTHLTKVRRSGNDNIIAACPFHRKADGSMEQHPSFSMSLSKGLYFCFSCKAKGNLRTFLRDIGTPPIVVEKAYGTLLEELSKAAVPKAQNATNPDFLKQEGIPEDLLGLLDYCPVELLQAGFNKEVLKYFEVGYDEINTRITYPLRDLYGKLLGISGRALDPDDSPRYKIYTQEDFNRLPGDKIQAQQVSKRNILWNAHHVYPIAYFDKRPYTVIVEGFKACMWLHQAGITNVMAALGSHLSWEQQWILSRIGGTTYLMFDNDEAGIRGMYKSGRYLARFMPVKIVQFDAHQPDDIDPECLNEEALMTNAVDFYQWASGIS